MERQKVVEKEAETEMKMAVTSAEKDALVSKIRMEQIIMEKESIKMQQIIENEMYLNREKSLADSNFYRYITGCFHSFKIFSCLDLLNAESIKRQNEMKYTSWLVIFLL